MKRVIFTAGCVLAWVLGGGCKTLSPSSKENEESRSADRIPEGEILLGGTHPSEGENVPHAEERLIGSAQSARSPKEMAESREQLLPMVSPEGIEPLDPAHRLSGFSVVRVGSSGSYVLLKAPTGVAEGTTLLVFRKGKPVGMVRVSGPRQPGWLSADIVEGDIQRGDIARP